MLLSSHLPGHKNHRYGEPSRFFDTIQLTLSHLLLSPQSAFAHTVSTSRSNYNLYRVYNYQAHSVTLFRRKRQEELSAPSTVRSDLFPNLRMSTLEPPKIEYWLDTRTLLHIRNFWHRHLIDDSEPSGEHTYAAMARGLATLGRTPSEWKQPLQSDVSICAKWYGHYSALYPWPTSKKQLEERQSVAEDWYNVDPMVRIRCCVVIETF
jgi:hypothetical protein